MGKREGAGRGGLASMVHPMYVAAGARRPSHSLARQRLRRAKESKPCQHVRDRERQRHRTWAAGPGITRGYAQLANNIFLSHQTSISQSVIIFSHDKSAPATSHNQPNTIIIGGSSIRPTASVWGKIASSSSCRRRRGSRAIGSHCCRHSIVHS